jgi:hypothetical protein
MSNLLAWAPAIRAEGVVRTSTGEGRRAFKNRVIGKTQHGDMGKSGDRASRVIGKLISSFNAQGAYGIDGGGAP